jgi:hypothetical protein
MFSSAARCAASTKKEPPAALLHIACSSCMAGTGVTHGWHRCDSVVSCPFLHLLPVLCRGVSGQLVPHNIMLHITAAAHHSSCTTSCSAAQHHKHSRASACFWCAQIIRHLHAWHGPELS